ncbi:site-specific integrase [Lysinibacillus parviboronicapiens]|uniref:site-specific integrase n=1 Tax=Lysinibacillus parviboronicapiens TaxID=436516 RepID=UPI000D33C6DB|nr:site-specific integrase [Lysinibacillus parviboronicapiens]
MEENLNIFTLNEYDEDSVEDSKKILKDLKLNSKLNQREFEEDFWEFFCEANHVFNKFDFTKLNTYYKKTKILKYNADLKVLLKCWVANNIGTYSLSTMELALKVIIDFFNISMEMESSKVGEIKEVLNRVAAYKQEALVNGLLNLNFYDEDLLSESLVTYISNLKFEHSNKTRVIFLLIFHEKIRSFEMELSKKPHKVQLLHYLIRIWWEISMFVPMRPIEVARIKYKNIKKVDNKIHLTFDRNKGNGNLKTTVLLSESTYQLIQKYYKESREYGKSVTLFSKKALPQRKSRDQRLLEYFNRVSLDFAINKYLSMVFNDAEKELYQNDLNLFTPIVTRHISIINLIRQGYNPYEIAELAGHRSTITQYHYSRHLENLIDVDLLNIFNSFNYDKEASVYTVYRQFKKVVKSIDELPKIRHELPIGFCIEENIRCPVDGSCFDCHFWRITKDQLTIYYRDLAEHKKAKQNQIKDVLIKMVELYQNIQKYKKKRKIDKDLDIELKENAKKLEGLMSQFKDFEQVFFREVISDGQT